MTPCVNTMLCGNGSEKTAQTVSGCALPKLSRSPGFPWIYNVGYQLFPWVSGAPASNPQNIMHLAVTVVVVVFSWASLALSAGGAKKEQIQSLCVWAVVCLAAMIIGPIGTSLLPKTVFGLFERFSTFSAVVFNAVLGIHLIKGRFTNERIDHITKKEQEDAK